MMFTQDYLIRKRTNEFQITIRRKVERNLVAIYKSSTLFVYEAKSVMRRRIHSLTRTYNRYCDKLKRVECRSVEIRLKTS